MKRMKFFLAALCFLFLTGCQSKELPVSEESNSSQPTSQLEEANSAASTAGMSSEETVDSPTSGVTSGNGATPNSTASEDTDRLTTASSRNSTQPDVTPPATNSSSSASTRPPVTENPQPDEPDPPTESETSTKEPPASSEPSSTTPEYDLVPGQLYDDPEDDPYGIVAIIRDYAESKGFVLNQSLNMENSGWRGRPNITDWTLEGVIDTLKYHVDKIFDRDGPTYYNVAFWIYQGKLEYMFLTA